MTIDRNRRTVFKGLQQRPVQSYENYENYEIYENCKIYDSSQDRLIRPSITSTKCIQRVARKTQSEVTKNTKFTKTAKFTIIRNAIEEIDEMYSKGCNEDPSEVTRIYENCEIYYNSQCHWGNRRNLFKGLQGGPIQSYENYEIYKNCKISWNSQSHWWNVFIGLQV